MQRDIIHTPAENTEKRKLTRHTIFIAFFNITLSLLYLAFGKLIYYTIEICDQHIARNTNLFTAVF